MKINITKKQAKEIADKYKTMQRIEAWVESCLKEEQ